MVMDPIVERDDVDGKWGEAMYVMSSGSRSRTITAEHVVECVRELEARSFRS